MLRISYKNHSYYINGKVVKDELCEKIGWYLTERKEHLDEIVRLYGETLTLQNYESNPKIKEWREKI